MCIELDSALSQTAEYSCTSSHLTNDLHFIAKLIAFNSIDVRNVEKSVMSRGVMKIVVGDNIGRNYNLLTNDFYLLKLEIKSYCKEPTEINKLLNLFQISDESGTSYRRLVYNSICAWDLNFIKQCDLFDYKFHLTDLAPAKIAYTGNILFFLPKTENSNFRISIKSGTIEKKHNN
jgi:hypothetical protein